MVTDIGSIPPCCTALLDGLGGQVLHCGSLLSPQRDTALNADSGIFAQGFKVDSNVEHQ